MANADVGRRVGGEWTHLEFEELLHGVGLFSHLCRALRCPICPLEKVDWTSETQPLRKRTVVDDESAAATLAVFVTRS